MTLACPACDALDHEDPEPGCAPSPGDFKRAYEAQEREQAQD